MSRKLSTRSAFRGGGSSKKSFIFPISGPLRLKVVVGSCDDSPESWVLVCSIVGSDVGLESCIVVLWIFGGSVCKVSKDGDSVLAIGELMRP